MASPSTPLSVKRSERDDLRDIRISSLEIERDFLRESNRIVYEEFKAYERTFFSLLTLSFAFGCLVVTLFHWTAGKL